VFEQKNAVHRMVEKGNHYYRVFWRKWDARGL
jgi:hypothetical protein